MKKDLAEYEFRNWSRWCNSGPNGGPPPLADPRSLYDDAPLPINEDNAKIVQRIFDSAILVERKVMQIEYLSPWQYARYSAGIAAAVRRLNASMPEINLSVSGYETILDSVKRRVERAFQ